MDKRKLSETMLAKKILLLKQKYKQQKKEERILMKRNKKLVNELQSHKETLKSLNDERLTLQKDIYDKKYAKALSEGNNIALKNSLSSLLIDLHSLQTKVINSWRENQRERNRYSSKKPTESSQQESVEEETISEELYRHPREDVVSSPENVLQCKVEALNGQEVEPVLSSHCDLTENKQDLSLLLSSFCRRDTVPFEKTSEPCDKVSENVSLARICDPDNQEPDNVSLERTCEQDFQESENVSLERTCEPGLQGSENVLLEKTCESDHLKLENEAERTSPIQEPFHGFVEDANEKAKFTEMIEKLSVKCETLESLRNYEIAQSLTFESNPAEVIAKEASAISTLEVDLSKHYGIQQLEVSIPRLDLSAYPSLNSTIEVPKKDVSRGRKSSQREERNQRDTTPDSASESSGGGRVLRRGRNAVSYKEKPLNSKLRRN